MKSKLLPLFFILSVWRPLLAQTDSIVSMQELVDELEWISEEITEESAEMMEELLEVMEELQQERPNLNQLSYETATKLLQLSDYQYYQLQLYIEEHGQLASIYELDIIEGFGQSERRRLSRIVRVTFVETRSSPFRSLFRQSSHRLLVRYGRVLESQSGYDTTRSNHYAGTPDRLCFQYTFNTQDKFILKISGEKDPGEQFFRGEQKQGFDFYAGSFSIQNIGILKKLVLGDYRLNFGQGLAIGSTFLSGKGGGPDALRTFSTGIRAVAPINEGSFLRGAAITLGRSKWYGTLFGGRSYGTLDNYFGADLNYRHRLFKVGVRLVAETKTDTTGGALKQRLRSTLEPTGFTGSIDYQVLIRRNVFFGEVALNEEGKIGGLHALVCPITPTLKTALLFRHYAIGFHAPLGKGFGINSSNSGENGLYLTATWIAGRRCEFTYFADYYRLTWPSYRADAPVSGLDMGLSGQFIIQRNSQLTLKYTFRQQLKNDGDNDYYHELWEQYRHKIRLQWSYNPTPFCKLKSGFQGQFNHTEQTQSLRKSFLFYQDAAIDFGKTGISLHARVAIFDTDSYDERLYAYEDDVYYAFTIGSYYYQGVRDYLVVRYKHHWFTIWVRMSHTYYTDRTTIGSGLTQIDKPHKTEIKAQVMFRL